MSPSGTNMFGAYFKLVSYTKPCTDEDPFSYIIKILNVINLK